MKVGTLGGMRGAEKADKILIVQDTLFLFLFLFNFNFIEKSM